jgi:hypothetical protein
MKTRLLMPPVARRAPSSPIEWERLMQVVLTRAEARADPRLNMLKAAMPQGKTEQVLRQMGIICENDVQREFPLPTT